MKRVLCIILFVVFGVPLALLIDRIIHVLQRLPAGAFLGGA